MEIDSIPQAVAVTPTMVEDFLNVGEEFEQFANDLDDCLSPLLSLSEKRDRILDLPQKYYKNALGCLAKLQRGKPPNSHDDADMDVDEFGVRGYSSGESDRVKQVQREAQTWDLLRRLIPLRHQSSETHTHLSTLHRLADKPATSDSLHHFLTTNTEAKERRAVLRWLQTNAASGPEIDELTRELQQNADRGDIIAHGWLHTRSSIKLKKSVTGWPHLLDRQSANISKSHTTSSGAPLVTQLDPDACTRQGRKLQPQDEYFERAIWLGCFEHLRRGSSMETIREWCQERTEAWRAISMSAMLLSAEEDEAPIDVDPAALTLWRRMCFGLARQGGSDDYERAVYGILSGDIMSVEKVALTWDDYLFAHYNALLRAQIDQFLLEQCPLGTTFNLTAGFSSFDAIGLHGDQEGVEKRLVRLLESQAETKREALEPNKALQASIIGKEVDDYLYQQGLALSSRLSGDTTSVVARFGIESSAGMQSQKYFKSEQRDGLRIVAHVFVLVALLERLEAEERLPGSVPTRSPHRSAQENIIAQYADLLRRAGLQELVPLYCSLLEPPRLYEVLSSNLILEQELEKRLTQLKLIKRANINVLQFVQVQASMLYERLIAETGRDLFEAKDSFQILGDEPPSSRFGRRIKADFFGEDGDTIDSKHDHLIRALEWLLLVDETWPNVFSTGTQIYKYFLRHMHLQAARTLMERVPWSEVMKDLGVEDGEDEELGRVEFWADQLERKGIDGSPEKVMTDARNFRELEALVKALDSIETVASMVEISPDVPPPSNRDFWANFGGAVKTTKENMEPLLKNWLMAGVQDGDEELKDLRRAYLPETILAYISALHVAGTSLSRDWLLECMQLAALITERDSDLESLFVESQRVRELLESFTASSKALAIATGEKRATGTGNKKLRELGWSRDIWSVRSS